MRSLRRNKSGVLAIWIIAFLSLFVFLVGYITLGMPAMAIVQVVLNMPNLDPHVYQTANMAINTFIFAGAIFVFGILLWVMTASRKREVVDF